jgi:two-component system cell cycle sensor histidine kinase/response regulator CckA
VQSSKPRKIELNDLPLPACLVEAQSLTILGANIAADLLFGFTTSALLDKLQPWNNDKFRDALLNRDFASTELRGVTGFGANGKAELQLDLLVSEHKQGCLLFLFAEASSRIRLEEQLRQAQKMESVGMLAGGIAHDFNNLLTIISGYSHMLASSLSADERNRSAAEQIIKASDRAAALTKQLLSFSRRQVAHTKVLDLNLLVQGMVPMLNRIIGEHIRLRISPGLQLSPIHADPGQIEQIIMNLVVNARDAMPNGGNLWIETANADLDPQYMARHMEARSGRYVMLAVTDSGIGMDATTREKIFEPFFTTKDESHGTGLGLSTVYGIAKRSGGAIDVYSEPGKGTAVKVYLPRVEGVDTVPAPETPQAARGTETLLLVEDDEAVRNIVKAALEAQGYRLLVAASGEEALLLAQAHPGPIDLLVTDVVLPELNGKELARRLHKKRRDTVVLFMSGYTDVTLNDGTENRVHFIGKPFTPAALNRKVRELLDGRTASHGAPSTLPE